MRTHHASSSLPPRRVASATSTSAAMLGLLLLCALPAAGQECVERNDVTLDVALDISGSMAGAKLVGARDFAVALIDQLQATNALAEAASFTFCSTICANNAFQDPTIIRNATAGIAITCADPGLAMLCPDGTALFDAIILGSNGIRARSAPIKLLVVITDGLNTTSSTTAADAAAALAPPGIVARLVFVGAAVSPELSNIAAAAGPHVQAIAATAPNLGSLVGSIVDATCSNHRPTAAVALSDAELRLGHEGFAITFDGSPSSDAEDADGSLTFAWELRDPTGAVARTASGMSFTHTFDDSRLPGADWSVHLTVTDTRGSTASVSRPFRVLGSPPEITVSGPRRVQVGQSIQLQASPTTDVDGGNLTIAWSAPRRPPSASAPSFAAGPTASVPTSSTDIGSWTFRATATDDEGETDSAEIAVEVANAPPEIELVGTSEVSAGQSIEIHTTSTEDPDGGDLTFRWDIVQSPQSGHVRVREGYLRGTGASGASLSIPTTVADAGHWIIRLVATDDDNSPDSETSEELAVHVDAPPEAVVDAPALIGSSSFPLVLDGSGSVDPDSPCPNEPRRCHDTLDGRAVAVPADPLAYTWSLVDMPGELWGSYTLGVVDDALGLFAHNPRLTIDYGLLEPGDWTFELEVVDGEGNHDSARATVAIADENGHPTAAVTGPARYQVTAGGFLDRDIILSGRASFDRDNLLAGEALGPGLGIARYDWEILQLPPGCTPPALPAGPNAHTFTLYAAGHQVLAPCQGIWRFQLTVTDDDPSPQTDFAETLVGIGNCPQPLCIDHPTTARPQIVDFPPATDIPILYRVDSTLYDAPELGGGLVARLAIYHQSDPTNPVYVSPDTNVLASDRGSQLAFQWDGRDRGRPVPRQGHYTVEVSLLDARLNETTYRAVEPDALWIQYVEYRILPESDTLVPRGALAAGTDRVTIRYESRGGPPPEVLRWYARDGLDRLVVEGTAPAAAGSFEWNGRNAAGEVVAAGDYRVRLEPFRRGISLGLSEPHTVTVFDVSLHWTGVLASWDHILTEAESLAPGSGAELIIVTEPRQLTAAELAGLGLPLELFAHVSLVQGNTMTVLTGSNGEVGGTFLRPPEAPRLLPGSATFVDTQAGVVATFTGLSSPLPQDEEDAFVEIASWDDSLTTPATSNRDDSDTFDAGFTGRGWLQAGRARNAGSQGLLEAVADRTFVIHGGTEQIWFRLWGVESERRQVRQQADWLYYSGHGFHLDSTLLPPDGAVRAADVDWHGDLDLVVIAGCSVVDIKDYRAKSFGPAIRAEWRLAGGPSSPGESWEASGPDFILGYAWRAPFDTQGTVAIAQRFVDAINAGANPVEAWRDANDPAIDPIGSNAAAIDVSQTPHRYCFFDERTGTAVWTCVDKTSTGWPEIPSCDASHDDSSLPCS